MHENQTSGDSIKRVLADVRALSRRHVRDAGGRFWIEGIRHFIAAFDAGFKFETVIHSRVLLKSSLAEMLVRRLAARGVRPLRVSPEQFRSVATLARASGIGAIVRQRWSPMHSIEPARGIGWLVVEELRSPGNLGTILRTGEACGAGGVIFLGPYCDPFDPAVVRASMGGIFHLPLVRTSHQSLRRWAEQRRVCLVGLSPDAPRLWTDLPAGTIALVLGEERGGLSPRLRAVCDQMVRLPMTGRADSLNVAVAAGVVMYELVRRRPLHPTTTLSGPSFAMGLGTQ